MHIQFNLDKGILICNCLLEVCTCTCNTEIIVSLSDLTENDYHALIKKKLLEIGIFSLMYSVNSDLSQNEFIFLSQVPRKC
jgi:hypothetical protein